MRTMVAVRRGRAGGEQGGRGRHRRGARGWLCGVQVRGCEAGEGTGQADKDRTGGGKNGRRRERASCAERVKSAKSAK